jgi:hypothetical protein
MAFTARLGRLATQPSANVLRVDESQSEVMSWMRRENSCVRGELASARDQVAVLERFLGQKGAHDAKLWDVMRELEGTRQAATQARRRVDELEAEVAKAQCAAAAAAAAAEEAAARVARETAAAAEARHAAAAAAAKGAALEGAVDRMARQLAEATGMAHSEGSGASAFTRLLDVARGAVQSGLSSRPQTPPPAATSTAFAPAPRAHNAGGVQAGLPVRVRMVLAGDRIVVELNAAVGMPPVVSTPIAPVSPFPSFQDASRDLSPSVLQIDESSIPASDSSPPPAPRTVTQQPRTASPKPHNSVPAPPIHDSIVNLRHALDASLHGAAQQHSLRQTQALRESARACAAGSPDAPVDAGAVQHLLTLFMRVAKAATAFEATRPPPAASALDPSSQPSPDPAPLSGIMVPEESLSPKHLSESSTPTTSGGLPHKDLQSESITPRHSTTSTPATSGALPPRDFLKPKTKQPPLAEGCEAVPLPPHHHHSEVPPHATS